VESSFDLGAAVDASGLRCEACGDGRCARRHALRFRERVTDLTTGEVFENLPIVRIVFCSGKTGSLVPSELWRGRFTVSSVIESVVRVHRDGVEAASEWALYAGTGDEVVSERTLRRWREIVRTRFVGSALSSLGPMLGMSWSDASESEPASQLDLLLERLSRSALLAFRALAGHAVIDKPAPAVMALPARTTARRVQGLLIPTPPHEMPSPRLPRGAWSQPRKSRAPPRLHRKEPSS
jgi:hypothetical protein